MISTHHTIELNGYIKLKSDILDKNLCTYCGTCVGCCPTGTLKPVNGTIIDSANNCINCNLCNQICPGGDFDYKYFICKMFSKPALSYDIITGHYNGIFCGHASNPHIRENGSSGGVVSQLLISSIEYGYADGVIVLGNLSTDLTAKITILTNKDDIIAAASSKYILSPTNVILKDIIGTNQRYFYVGLPCQIHGLQKAFERIPSLRKSIVLIIGLFCGFTMHSDATKFLIKKSRIPQKTISTINFRKKRNNQTGFEIESNAKKYFIPKHAYSFLNLFYSPYRCSLCYDYTAEFSDISVGDAWECGLGWSRIITRSEQGLDFLNYLNKKSVIHLEPSSPADIAHTQQKILAHKKTAFWLRKKHCKFVPDYNIDYLKPTLTHRQWIQETFMNFLLWFAHSKLGIFLLHIIPFRALTKLSEWSRK